jgi:Flp pilus assembly protein TadG
MIFRTVANWNVKRAAAHTVEFALVFPVFVIFIFGLVEIGRGMMASTLITNAARTGCRTGTLPGMSDSDVTTAVDNLLQNQGIAGYTTTVTLNGSTKTDVSAGQTGDTVMVTVSVPASSISWIPGAGYLVGNLSGNFSMPHE